MRSSCCLATCLSKKEGPTRGGKSSSHSTNRRSTIPRLHQRRHRHEINQGKHADAVTWLDKAIRDFRPPRRVFYRGISKLSLGQKLNRGGPGEIRVVGATRGTRVEDGERFSRGLITRDTRSSPRPPSSGSGSVHCSVLVREPEREQGNATNSNKNLEPGTWNRNYRDVNRASRRAPAAGAGRPQPAPEFFGGRRAIAACLGTSPAHSAFWRLMFPLEQSAKVRLPTSKRRNSFAR